MTFRIDLPETQVLGSTFRYQDPTLVSDVHIKSALTVVNPVITTGESEVIPVGQTPATVLVGGSTYTPVEVPSALTSNTFFFNPVTRVIEFSDPISSSDVAVYLRNSITPQIQNLSRLVTSLKRFHVHNIQIDRTWKDQPSASLVFKVPFTERNRVIEMLRPGHDFQLLDIGLQVSDLTIVEMTQVHNNVREIEVTVAFEGKWSGERLRPQPYLNPDELQLGPRNYFDPGYTVSLITNGSEIPASTTLQKIAERSGTSLLIPDVAVTIPRQGAGEVYDWAGELESLADNAETFLYWSNSDGIQFRDWEAVTTHTITESQIKSDISGSLPRAARDLPGDVLESYRWQTKGSGVASLQPDLDPGSFIEEPTFRKHFEWEGANLEIPQGSLSIDEESRFLLTSENEESSDTTDQWLRRQRKRHIVESGSKSVPIWAVNVAETTANFDVTGFTQSFTRTWLVDGEPEREVVETYGFNFSGEDLQDAGGTISASDNWQMVEYKDTTHFRAGKTGYYLGYDTQGWRLNRYRQENKNDPETIGLADGAEKDLYIPKKLPFQESQSLRLAQFADFYPTDRFSNYSFATDAQGNQVLQSDPNYVEPMFVEAEQTTQFSAEFTDNPDDDSLPPLVTGKENVTIRQVTPLVSNLTPYFRSGSLATLSGEDIGDLSEDEYYVETVNSYSAESTGFDGVAQQDERNVTRGRPGEAARLPNRYEPQQRSRTEVNSPAPRSYHLFSEGYDDTPRGSVSFPNAVTVSMIERAAKSQLYYNNLTQGLSESLVIVFNPNLKEGDKVNLYYNGVLRRRRIQSVSHDIVLDGTINFRASETNLELVRDPGYDNPIFDIALRPDAKNSVSFYLSNPLFSGRKLGTIRRPEGLCRLKFV